MICGLVNLSGGPVSAIGASRRLPETANGSVMGPDTSVAVVADSSVLATARVGAITCVLDGVLSEPRRNGANPAEVVAEAYRRERLDALAALRGQFTLVIWDSDARDGVLATDVLATRTLYTHAIAGGLLFAGEIRDLLPLLASQPGPDPVAFPAWLASGGTSMEGRTLYEGIGRLGPGQCVAIGGGRATTKTYWQPRFAAPQTAGREQIVEGLREMLLRVTDRRLSAGTDGVILSGGLDSSIVTAAAHAAKPPGALRAYSAIFPGAAYDEHDKIQALTDALDVDGRAFQVAPQGMLWLALRYLKEWRVPLAGLNAIIDLTAAELAGGDGICVLLDGQAGDEVLGFAPYLIADRLRHGRLRDALALIDRWPGRPPIIKLRAKRWLLREYGLKGVAPYSLGQRVRQRHRRRGGGPPWLLPHLQIQAAELDDRWGWKQRGRGPLWWRYLADLHIYAPHRTGRPEYLRHRAAANGVTAASPLYDPDLIGYMLSIPPELQFDPATDRPLARAAMHGLLPEPVRLQPKKSNYAPFSDGALTGAERQGVERVLTAPDALIGAYVDREWVHRAWAALRDGSASQPAWLIWQLATAELWLRLQSDPEWIDALLDDPAIPRVSVLDPEVTA